MTDGEQTRREKRNLSEQGETATRGEAPTSAMSGQRGGLAYDPETRPRS